MTDLHRLLTEAASHRSATPAAAQVEADVARGIRALRRRRAGATGGTLALAVAVAALPLSGAAGPMLGRDRPDPGRVAAADHGTGPGSDLAAQAAAQAAQAARTSLLAARAAAAGRLRLVRYTGPTPPGSYRVGLIPKGWEIQGGNAYRLTLGEVGDSNQDPDSLDGKIVVTLAGTSRRITSSSCGPAGPTCTAYSSPALAKEAVGSVAVVVMASAKNGNRGYAVLLPPWLRLTTNDQARLAASVTVLASALPPPG